MCHPNYIIIKGNKGTNSHIKVAAARGSKCPVKKLQNNNIKSNGRNVEVRTILVGIKVKKKQIYIYKQIKKNLKNGKRSAGEAE